MFQINPKSLISTVTIVKSRNTDIDAKVNFHCYSLGKHHEDSLSIHKKDNGTTFIWKNKNFSASIREYLELRALVEVDNELLLKQSEINF
ncbi:MAG: hypothetical protein HQK83_17945 [Fibrobacteria bacterium]|nr:hypothetical protein [Fibrobacteria bacterium]